MANRATRRLKAPKRQYQLTLEGDLEGFEVTMTGMSGSTIVDLRSGKLDQTQIVELVTAAVVHHNFAVASIADLDLGILLDIVKAWGVAMRDRANPPTTGDA